MKILHVIPSTSAADGGPTVALETMTRALVQQGVSVDVATTDDDGGGHLNVPLGEPMMRAGVRHWVFARQTNFYKVSLPLTRWLERNMQQYDILHIHALFSFASLPAAFFASPNGVPYIVRPLGTLHQYGMTRHHPTLKRLSYMLVERRILERAAYIHYTSELERQEAQAIGVTTRSLVIPLGIDTSAFEGGLNRAWIESHAPQFRDRVVFLFLSRLDPKKQIELLLDSFAQVQTPRMGLIIAGDGDATYTQKLHERAAALNLSDAVLWVGFVGGDEKSALLRAADVFVLPSASENFGIAVVEAMAAGLPVIVTPQVGIAREIIAAGAGILVSSESQSLGQAIGTLAENESLRHEIGVRAWKLAREKFSIDGMTRGLLEMYNTLMWEMYG